MSISAYDLPQLWQKPAYEDLLDALKKLRVDPPVWNLKISRAEILREQDTTVHHRREIAGYLSNIISNELTWIEDEDQREDLWNEASRRLSERCGRAAMGEITRRWPFEGEEHQSFDLTIREPPLTGDSLGLKTWGSSYLLAQMLHKIGQTSLSHLLSSSGKRQNGPFLELGSGTGLLGVAAAAIWQAHVILSDLPVIMPNLQHNANQNREVVESLGGSLDAGALTWGGDETDDEIDGRLFFKKQQFKIVLVADPLYDDDHPRLLAGAIDDYLSVDADARALVMVPQRDATTVKLLASFRSEMEAKPSRLCCLEESLVFGQDDWGEGDEEEQVKCWLGIFGRRCRSLYDTA